MFQNKKYRITLASQSPRRRQLLEQLGFIFSTTSLDIDESYPKTLKAAQITEYLVEKKAKAYASIHEKEILITADTIVWHNQQALEKPKNKKEAIEMLLSLSDKMHKVYTSVCIKTLDEQTIFTDATEVHFSIISEEEAKYYVEKYTPLDKAGSYGIQDWLGLTKISSINGNFYTVMGLPTHLLYDELKKLT